ncbi:MAG: amidase [Cyclobacteriaceae bacterium]
MKKRLTPHIEYIKGFFAITLMKVLPLTLIHLVLACSPQQEKSSDQQSINLSDEVTIAEIQEAYHNGTYSITDVTNFYLKRIQNIDQNGIALNSVLTINPEAMNIAAILDQEMLNGDIRGPLHGIPVLLKDNIDTGDEMPCTAGSIVMKDAYPQKDSPLAAQLRAAGAVILGKTNLSEWANFHSTYSSSGWSSLGGQTKNPYDLTRNPCGSSAGSGVAVSANLCVIAIGTETNGSIVCPSTSNGIVGIKPTVGLVSRTGIIPISFTQDTGGPMARTLTDAVICLGALTAVDSADRKTLSQDRVAYQDYTAFLNENGISGKRLGFYKSRLNDNQRLTEVIQEAITFFESKGATIIELDEFLNKDTEPHSFKLMLYEFKDGLNRYFQQLGDNSPIKNLEELIDRTLNDSLEMRYFDHALLKQAQDKGNLQEEEYLEALQKARDLSRTEGIDKVMNEYQLDAIIAPTGSPAWKTDLTNGDHYTIYSSSPAAIAGYPNITVPMGQIDGLPVGISIFGRPWSEPKLIEIAYGFEQGTKHRFSPGFSSGL